MGLSRDVRVHQAVDGVGELPWVWLRGYGATPFWLIDGTEGDVWVGFWKYYPPDGHGDFPGLILNDPVIINWDWYDGATTGEAFTWTFASTGTQSFTVATDNGVPILHRVDPTLWFPDGVWP